MLGEAFGRWRWLPVDMTEVGAARCATVEDKEKVARRAQDDRPDVIPPNFTNRAITFAVRNARLGWPKLARTVQGRRNRDCNLLLLGKLLELVLSFVKAGIAADHGRVELRGGGLRPFGVGRMLVARIPWISRRLLPPAWRSRHNLSRRHGRTTYLLNTSSFSSSRLPCP